MLQPGRKYTAGTGYRYGFNGKENDNEVKGDGNQQDYGMRIYDARLVRFLSVDPMTGQYPWYTPYQFAGNMLIWATDLDGLEENTTSTYVYNPPILLNSSKGTARNSSSGMNLGVLKIEKQSYNNIPWVTSNPFQRTKQQTFANNVMTSAWNQGVESAEFSYNYLTSKQYRKDFQKSVLKTAFKGIMWLATTDDDEKWEDVKSYVSDVNNWEDFGGTLLLGKMTTNFTSFKSFGKTPITTPGIKLSDIGRVGRRLLGLSDRKLNDMEVRIFGSTVKGASNPNDLDVLIITNNTDLFKPGSRLEKILESIKVDFKNNTGKELDINIMTPEEFRRAKGGAFKADVEKNSIKLRR